MAVQAELLVRIREWVKRAGGQRASDAEIAVLRSMVLGADDAVLECALRDLFDSEPVALAVLEVFLERGRSWPTPLRESLAQALLFHGFDREAEPVLRSLAQAN